MKKLKWFIIVVVLAGLGFGFFKLYSYSNSLMAEEKEQLANQLEAYNAVIKPLQAEKEELTARLEELNEEDMNAAYEMSAVSLVFTETYSSFLDQAVPVAKEFGYTGVIGLNEEMYPGMSGMISKDDFAQLLEEGWSWCLLMDTNTDVGKIMEKASNDGFGEPRSAYFSSSQSCTSDSLDLLRSFGVSVVAIYGESDFEHVPSVGSNETGAKKLLETTVAAGDSIAITTGSRITREKYSESNFRAMLKIIEDYDKQGILMVTDIPETLSRLSLAQKLTVEAEQKLVDEKQAIQDRLAEIEEEILTAGK